MTEAVTWQGVLVGALLFCFLVGLRNAWGRWGHVAWRPPVWCRKCAKRMRRGGGEICWSCSSGGKDISKFEPQVELTQLTEEQKAAKKEAFRKEMRARNAKAQ